MSRGFLEETLDSYAPASGVNNRFGVWRQGGTVYGFASGSEYGTDKEKGLISSIFSGWSNDGHYYRGLFQIDSDLCRYVLTAVKEGDQTTYAWEPIDRSETESATPTDE